VVAPDRQSVAAPVRLDLGDRREQHRGAQRRVLVLDDLVDRLRIADQLELTVTGLREIARHQTAAAREREDRELHSFAAIAFASSAAPSTWRLFQPMPSPSLPSFGM